MEYVIFPMKYIRITQRHDGTVSHKWNSSTETGIKAIDCGGLNGHSNENPIYEEVLAPTTVKVLKKETRSNTVYFGTCDYQGNPAVVRCEDSADRILTFALTHMSDTDFTNIGYYVGKVFNSGTVFYRQGVKGNVTGAHIHIEIANGWINSKTATSSQGSPMFASNVSLYPHQVFFQLSSWNVEVYLNGYSYASVSNRGTPDNNLGANVYGLRIKNLKNAYVRKGAVAGDIITTLPINTELPIDRLLEVRSDKYQWVRVVYNGQKAYVQLDTKGFTILTGTPDRPIYLYANGHPFAFRNGVQGAGITGKTPITTRGQITGLLGIQSDGYQWATIHYSGSNGYSQVDTYDWNYVGV